MTSFIAAGGSGRSASFIPAVPAAWSVTTIAFIVHLPCVVGRHGPGEEMLSPRRWDRTKIGKSDCIKRMPPICRHIGRPPHREHLEKNARTSQTVDAQDRTGSFCTDRQEQEQSASAAGPIRILAMPDDRLNAPRRVGPNRPTFTNHDRGFILI